MVRQLESSSAPQGSPPQDTCKFNRSNGDLAAVQPSLLTLSSDFSVRRSGLLGAVLLVIARIFVFLYVPPCRIY